MTTHTRSKDITAISVSIPVSLLERVDARARALGLNRSQYLAQLARSDIAERGAMTLREEPPISSTVEDIVASVVDGPQPPAATKPVTYAAKPKAPRRSKPKPSV